MKRAVKVSKIKPKVRRAMDRNQGSEEKPDATAGAAARDTGGPKSPLGDQGPGNVDKIRDILFGSQMRDYEIRFSRLEEGLRKESSDLRESTRKRLDTLESYVKNELESLQSRLRSEREERSDALGRVSDELKSTAAALTRKIGDAGDQSAEGLRDLRKELLQQSNDLNEEIRAKTGELAALLESRVQELRNDKTDRAALASLLTEVAMRLTDEFRIPATE